MNILAIESSCDETAAAIVKDGTLEISSMLATSQELHEKTGGVIPEVAARKQVEFIQPVISETLEKADMTEKDIDAIAVTVGPGLIGSLIVGVEAAKALSLAWNKPLLPINHLVGHIYGNYVRNAQEDKLEIPELPALVLIVSGGHTDLVLMRNHGDLQYLGGTLDDAAGEAFDKTARLLGLKKYLGAPELQKKAAECKENTLQGRMPRPKIKDKDYDFSFSGLKTSARRIIENEDHSVESISCEFQNAALDVIVEKTIRAAKEFDVKSILLGGGVAANKELRTRLRNQAENINKKIFIPPMRLCGDNAVYIASAAYFLYKDSDFKQPLPYDQIQADPSLNITD